jgi:hypothetical protein
MTQEQINVDLFDQVKKLQAIKRDHEERELRMAQEIDRMRGQMEETKRKLSLVMAILEMGRDENLRVQLNEKGWTPKAYKSEGRHLAYSDAIRAIEEAGLYSANEKVRNPHPNKP